MKHKALAAVLLLAAPLHAQQGNRKGHDNMEPVVPQNLVPPAPVLSPDDAMKSFELADGFAMQAFAAEPMIEKPVALDYDPAGRLWVCEMIGYMLDIDGTDEDKPMGRIVVLEDTNKDGKVTMEERDRFAPDKTKVQKAQQERTKGKPRADRGAEQRAK